MEKFIIPSKEDPGKICDCYKLNEKPSKHFCVKKRKNKQ
jgi:hypothetical protein